MSFKPLEILGGHILAGVNRSGAMLTLLGRALVAGPSVLLHPDRVIVQMVRAGYESLPIAAAMLFFTGLVLALHSGYALKQFRAEEQLATIVSLSIVKEMGPILAAMLLAGRVGAAIAAELGTMSVNEEIDALNTLGVSPISYLVAPRFFALLIMLPVLVVYSDLVGIGGGAVMAKLQFGVSYTFYFQNVTNAIVLEDVVEGLVKGTLFGAIVAIIACQFGLTTRGGAEGVGKSITRSVVTSFVTLFICDYFVTRFMNF